MGIIKKVVSKGFNFEQEQVPNIFELTLEANQIRLIKSLQTNTVIENFSYPLTSKHYKIYILTDKERILYIGITKDSIRNRLRSGLSANGEHGYHGYKWKNNKKVMLFVWCFDELDKNKIENIEAELAFIVRKTTGNWPECQNEIHFNNHYEQKGKLIAEKLYTQVIEKI